MMIKVECQELENKIYSFYNLCRSYTWISKKLYENYDSLSYIEREEKIDILNKLTDELISNDLFEFGLLPDAYKVFITHFNTAKEYSNTIYINSSIELKLLEFINKKIEYYEEFHKNANV